MFGKRRAAVGAPFLFWKIISCLAAPFKRLK